MNLNKLYKKVIAILLAFAIVVSGTNFIFPQENGHFLEFGQGVRAAGSEVFNIKDNGASFPIYSGWSESSPRGNWGPEDVYTTARAYFNGQGKLYFSNNDLMLDIYNFTGYCPSPTGDMTLKFGVYRWANYHLNYVGLYSAQPTSTYRFDLGNNSFKIKSYPKDSIDQLERLEDGSTYTYVVQVYVSIDITKYSKNYHGIGQCDGDIYPDTMMANRPDYLYPNGYFTDCLYVKNQPPTLASTTQGNEILSEADTGYIPKISVSDPDNDTLTCKYYIDSETTPRDTKTMTNTSTAKTVSFNGLNIGTLTDGTHTFKFEVSDGKVTTPVTQTVNFKVDKTNPTLGAITRSSTINTISTSGSATDSIAGLDATPYRYTIGSEVSAWVSSGTYTSKNDLAPNTQYLTKFEARDAKGHIASNSQNIYTKSAIPYLAVSNASSYTLDVASTDNNPASTQYQISINNGSQYITQEGNLTAAPTWVTLSNKKVTVKGLTPNSTYTFSAKARNGENIETASSSAVTGTTLVAPPGSPANIIATATDKTITVSWDAVNGAIGYDIEADGVAIDNGTATTYSHRNLNPGTPHKYKVRAKNAGGPGNWSNEIWKSTLPGSPDIPQNLNTIPLSTSVTVTWNNVPGATGYDIEVDGVLVNNGPSTSYIHNSLTPGTHHSYRVRSINPGGKSEWSSYVNTTTLVDTIPVPINIAATPALNKVTVSWDSVDGATGYDVEVDGITFDNSNRTTYSHSNLIPGTSHKYRVRAKKGGKSSEWSSMIVSNTLTNAFGTPANFKANANDTSVALSWDAVPESEGYDVEIDGIIIDNGMETSCIHDGLTPNTSHTYKVRARKSTETSDWTQPVTVTTYKLQTPQNITAVSDEESITVNWSPVNGTTSYDIEFDGAIISDIFKTSNSGVQSVAISSTTTDSAISTLTTTTDSAIEITTGSAITAAESSDTRVTYTITGLTPNTQHTIKVRAINESGTSNWSTPINQSTKFTTGNAPNVSGLVKKTAVTVMWNAMDGAASYDIEMDGVITSNVTGTLYNSTGLIPGTEHKYRVRAQNSSGEGNWSNTFTVSTLPEGPATPTNVATSGNMTSILVTWDKVAGAEEYEIEVDGVVINTGTGTSYLHTGLTPDTSHTYRVRTKNISGYSEWSETKTTKTLSSVQTYEINSIQGEEFDLMLTAANIQDLDKYTFTIQYNTDDFEVIDLCGLTAKMDTIEGAISGTDITVKQLAPGTIVFTKTGSAQSWQVWSGVVNSITFKAKKDGNSTITYIIQ